MNKLTPVESEVFMTAVKHYVVDNSWSRLGQAMFNVLFVSHPELADSVRATNDDCFYNDNNIMAFLQAVMSEEALNHLLTNYKPNS